MRALLLCFLVAAAPAVLAQSDYPNRPIRLIVTVPLGGAADFIARLVGAKLEALAQPVLVENRGGAGGTLAADAVAKAPADGYTLLQNSITTHGVGPHLYAKLPYDPVKDFAPVSGLALLPLIMAVTADLLPKHPGTGGPVQDGGLELRLLRQRRGAAHGGRALQERDRCSDHARPVQGQRSRGGGPGRRAACRSCSMPRLR